MTDQTRIAKCDTPLAEIISARMNRTYENGSVIFPLDRNGKIKTWKPWRRRALEDPAPSGNTDLSASPDSEVLKVEIISDGTSTVAQLIDPHGDIVGEGHARRRKGDPRNQEIGAALAVARACQDAAMYYAEIAEELLK
jgi:hypothetical protein